MLGVIAKLTIKPGTNADFEATMKALQAKVRADEPGNKLYALHKTSDDNVYVMLERYDDQAALRPIGPRRTSRKSAASSATISPGGPTSRSWRRSDAGNGAL